MHSSQRAERSKSQSSHKVKNRLQLNTPVFSAPSEFVTRVIKSLFCLQVLGTTCHAGKAGGLRQSKSPVRMVRSLQGLLLHVASTGAHKPTRDFPTSTTPKSSGRPAVEYCPIPIPSAHAIPTAPAGPDRLHVVALAHTSHHLRAQLNHPPHFRLPQLLRRRFHCSLLVALRAGALIPFARRTQRASRALR